MICLDTSTIIDLLMNKKDVIEKVKGISHDDLTTTRINVFEILLGVFLRRDREKQKFSEKVRSFMDSIIILELDEISCIQSAKINGDLIKSGKEIESTDCLTAGIMVANGCNTIITKNVNHFKRIKGIKVETY